MIPRSRPRRAGRDRGTVVLEVLVLAPVFFLLIDLAIYAGTAATVRSMAQHAADTAAREGSSARTGTDVKQEYNVGTNLLGSQYFADFVCKGPVTDNTPFGVPAGQRSSVTYKVTCVGVAKGVTFPGVPKQVTYTVTATSVIDPYRWRSNP